MGIDKRPAATLVPSRAPDRVNHALPITKDTGISVGALVRAAAGRQSKGLDMSAGETNGEQRLSRMKGRSEDIGCQGQRAGVFEHGYG